MALGNGRLYRRKVIRVDYRMAKSDEVKAVLDKDLSSPGNPRYMLMNTTSGEMLDVANGYGFKSKRNAYAAWNWENPDPEAKARKQETERTLREWTKKNRRFMQDMDDAAFCIFKIRNKKSGRFMK